MLEDLPRSRFIKAAAPVGEPVSLGGDGMGDLWPMTWSDDGLIYAGYGDGFGFDADGTGKKLYCGCAAVQADPEARTIRGHDVGLDHFGKLGYMYSGLTNVKPTGMLSVRGELYYFIQDISPDWRFGPCRDARLLTSSDHGERWEERGVFFPDVFTTPTFLQCGRDHRDAPDGFAYLYSPKYNWFEEDELFLARVPHDRIADRAAYEFFSGVGQPAWSGNIGEMRPVFANPVKYVQQCEVVYVKPLNRYLMVQWKLGTAQYNPNHDHRSELYLLEGPAPWGPWSVFHVDTTWGVDEHDYRYCGRIPADLIAPDGSSFWLQYSGWTPVQGGPATPYNWNLQRYRLTF